MTNLSTRAERGDVAGQLLRELASAIWTWTHCPEGVDTDLWVTRWNTFHKFLTINTPEAHLAAAMMLVPEGWTADVRRYRDGTGNAVLSEWSPPCRAHKSIGATTPAHALIAAIAGAWNMVTDEDRKAAAEWMAERMALVMGGESGSGEQSLIEAFARHRIAAEQRGYQQGMEEAAGVADGWDGKGGFGEATATAIRAKAEEKKHG